MEKPARPAGRKIWARGIRWSRRCNGAQATYAAKAPCKRRCWRRWRTRSQSCSTSGSPRRRSRRGLRNKACKSSSQILINPLADRMVDQLVNLLDAMRELGVHDELDVAAALGFAAVATQEGDGFHAAGFGGVDRGEDG